ncbi:helix-turn-helix domain-containing protein [Providencia rettgeri]
MTNNNTVASRLISRRAEMGLSQNQLAMEAKVAPAQISRYEAGINKPSIKTMGKLAEVLAVPFEWLAYGDDTFFPITNIAEQGGIELYLELPQELYDFLQKEAQEYGEGVSEVAKRIIELEKNKSMTKNK